MTASPKIRLAVLASGGGSNLQAILDACALERARKAGVKAFFIDPKDFSDGAGFYRKIIAEFQAGKIDLVLLAGYVLKLEPNIVKSFRGRILNIHPALLPKFGGKGMYGDHVHEAVLKAGEKESGATVHVVDEE